MRHYVKIEKDEAEVDEDADDLFSKMVAGCKGKIKIKTPFGTRWIKKVKKVKRPKEK